LAFKLVPPRSSNVPLTCLLSSSINHLQRPRGHRKALIRNLTTEVLRYGRITTTETKAKEVRRWVDKMIALSKRQSLHALRQMLGFIYDKKLTFSVYHNAPIRYGERNGGFCRVKLLDYARKGDAARMAILELV